MNNSSLIQYIINDYWQKNGDPSLAKYPLLSSGPWNLLLCVSLYLYFIKFLGPKIMKDRPAFDLRNMLRKYNFLMCIFNLWYFYKVCTITNWGIDTWKCPNHQQSGIYWHF